MLASCSSHLPALHLPGPFTKDMYNLFLRSPEEPVNANEEKDAGPGHTEHVSLQVSPATWAGAMSRGGGRGFT